MTDEQKRQLTAQETGRMGGHARAKNLSKERRVEIAKIASLAAKKKREAQSHAQNNK